ncbi:hypothetical protein B0H16DRAFT_1461491 [Mycena metata]|uniref:Uncharacterized protein n=1 Tax=Mycena metata TaxID=1033252 RepID=A0AAD7IUJ8_9AGAR|nr:hypothetical protein B0H16DRAFT_1461491 [Mycena metata]
MGRVPRSGKSRKQTKHLKKARDARGQEKENIPAGAFKLPQPPPSPKSHTLADNVRLVAEIKQLEKEKKNAARREKRLKKKNEALKKKMQEAQDELRTATAHSEARVRAVLKKKIEDDKGWQRRVAEAERKLHDAEFRRAWSKEELKKKISDLSHLRGALRLARRQNNRRNEVSKRATHGSCIQGGTSRDCSCTRFERVQGGKGRGFDARYCSYFWR